MLSSMRTIVEIWPPYGVSVTENDLKLTVITDEDIPGLVDLALGGIHEPDRMPFSTPWTAVEPELLPASMVRYYSSVRANFTPEKFELHFAVRIGGELVGTQGLHTSDFAVTRTGRNRVLAGSVAPEARNRHPNATRGLRLRLRSPWRGGDHLWGLPRQPRLARCEYQSRLPTQWPLPDDSARRRGGHQPTAGAHARCLCPWRTDHGHWRRTASILSKPWV